jgi:hypothetical protein
MSYLPFLKVTLSLARWPGAMFAVAAFKCARADPFDGDGD